MQAPIFSPQGYIAYAKKVFGNDSSFSGPTKEQCNMLLAGTSGNTGPFNNESETSKSYANDIILIDKRVVSLATPFTSGFVTLKVKDVNTNENELHAKEAHVLSSNLSRSNSNTRGSSISPSKGRSSTRIEPSKPIAIPSTGLLAPMTPIITCKLGNKNWPNSILQSINNIDAEFIHYFKDAVVVPINTMRLLGTEEGTIINFEIHSEKSVKEASSVVFSLKSDTIGEEISFDKCMRHFIAPFFLKCSRAISIGEEFEFKNHDHGELHINVVSINDGNLKCGIITDNTCIRLIIQPEAPPNLQGHGIISTVENNSSIRKRLDSVQDSPFRQSINQIEMEISPRPKTPASVLNGKIPQIISKENSQGISKPLRVHEPSPRRASRSAEPHSASSLLTYSPQSLQNNKIYVLKPKNPMISIQSLQDVKMDKELNILSTNDSDKFPNAITMDSPFSSKKQGSEGIKTEAAHSPQFHDTPNLIEESPVKMDPIKTLITNNKGDNDQQSSYRSLKTPEKDSSHQSQVELCCTPHQEIQNNVVNLEFNFNDTKPNSVHSEIIPVITTEIAEEEKEEEQQEQQHQEEQQEEEKEDSVITNLANSILQENDKLIKVLDQKRGVELSEKSDAATQYEAHSEDIYSVENQKKREISEENEIETPQEPAEVLPQEITDNNTKKEEENEKSKSAVNKFSVNDFELPLEMSTPMNLQPEKSETVTQYENLNNEFNSLEVQTDNKPSKDVFTEPMSRSSEKDETENLQESTNFSYQNEEIKESEDDEKPINISENLKHRSVSRLNERLPHDISVRASQIVQMWINEKTRWQKLPINPLLKREPYVIIKLFQRFIAVYKELKQRHSDCLAYLDSPYGHTLRGGMVLRISCIGESNNEEGNNSLINTPQGIKKSYNNKVSNTLSEKYGNNNNNNIDNFSFESNSEALSVAKAVEVLKVSVREISNALNCEVLHVFRVGGTCPVLYCTLIKPYNNGPTEITLQGASCWVEVLQTTIIEDLCESREESRQEWMKLSIEWSEAISGVLRLGVFTKHLQTLRELFWELALLLNHPGEVRHSAKYQRNLSEKISDENNYEFQLNNINKLKIKTPRSQSAPITERKIHNEYDYFIPYLQELQDNYYLFSELLEPFVIQSLHQLDIVTATTDVGQCEELNQFLQISYQAQLSEQESDDNGTPIPAAAAEEERAAFIALVEARKKGSIMSLPNEWWESGEY